MNVCRDPLFMLPLLPATSRTRRSKLTCQHEYTVWFFSASTTHHNSLTLKMFAKPFITHHPSNVWCGLLAAMETNRRSLLRPGENLPRTKQTYRTNLRLSRANSAASQQMQFRGTFIYLLLSGNVSVTPTFPRSVCWWRCQKNLLFVNDMTRESIR